MQYKASNIVSVDFGTLESAFKIGGEYRPPFSIEMPGFVQNMENFTKKILGKEIREFLKWNNNVVPNRIDIPGKTDFGAIFELKLIPKTKEITIAPGFTITISFDAIMKSIQIRTDARW